MGSDLYLQGLEPPWNQGPLPEGIPRLIGFSGWAGSGKSTGGLVVNTVFGHHIHLFAFRLKALAYDINPIVGFRQIETSPCGDPLGFETVTELITYQEAVDKYGLDEAKRTFPLLREFLQQLGTRIREHLGEDIWVENAMNRVAPDDYAVFVDVRFKNEANAIRAQGGKILRVLRPGVEPANGHISEHDLDDYDFDAVVINDGSVEDLEGEIRYLLGELQ